MTPIKISIVTISYNAEKTIEDTLKSVQNQNYSNLEYIIVDSKSTDRTMEIVKRYEGLVTKIICEKDKGISDAFNKGITAATGDVIGIINADDILCAGALDAVAVNYEEGIDVYRGKISKWDSEKDIMVEVEPSMDFSLKGNKIIVAHPGTFVTKNAYQKYGVYDLACKTMMDYDLLIRFARGGATFKYIPKKLACFRIGGITSDNKKVLKNTFKEIKERRYVLKKNSAADVVVLYETIRIFGKNIIKYVLRKS